MGMSWYEGWGWQSKVGFRMSRKEESFGTEGYIRLVEVSTKGSWENFGVARFVLAFGEHWGNGMIEGDWS